MIEWVEQENREGLVRRSGIFVAHTVKPRALALESLGDPNSDSITIFVSGGPGDPMLSQVDRAPYAPFFQSLARHSAVVFYDQRGVGLSEPFFEDFSVEFPADFLVDFSVAGSAIEKSLEKFEEYSVEIHTETSAADLSEFIAALDKPRVNLVAHSYGTHLVQNFLKNHSELVERAVLFGFEGPDQTWKLPLQFDAALKKLLAKQPAVLEEVQRAHEKLSKNPQKIAGVEFGAFGFEWMLSSWIAISSRASWIPAFAKAVCEGDEAVLGPVLQKFLRAIGKKSPVFYLCDRASWASPERLAMVAEQEKSSLFGKGANAPFNGFSGHHWKLSSDFCLPTQTEVPTLCVIGDLDAFTPLANVESQGGGFTDMNILTLENGFHNSYFGCPECADAINTFLSGAQIEQPLLSVPPIAFASSLS